MQDIEVNNALKKILSTPSELLGKKKKNLKLPLCDIVLVCVNILQAEMPLV